MKRKISALMVLVLIATMILKSDFVVRAERTDVSIGTNDILSDEKVATPSDGIKLPDNSSGFSEERINRSDQDAIQMVETISVNSIDELTAAISAFLEPSRIQSEAELDTINQRTATDSDALYRNTATASNATASNVLRTSGTEIIIELTQEFLEDFDRENRSIPLEGLPSGKKVTLKNIASGKYVSSGYDHFTMITTNNGTYVFQDFELYGGVDSSNKGIGGIKATGGIVELQNVSFYNFNSKAIVGTAKLEIYNCVFSGFSETCISEPDVRIDNSFFIDCNTPSPSHGSAIKIGNNLDISNSSLINCGGGSTIVGGYTAGAIGGIGSVKSLNVTNCYFTENHGNMYGGAISLYQFGGTVTIKDSYFLKNDCFVAPDSKREELIKSDGGAIGLFNNGQIADMTIDGCTFEGNIALDDAGALFVESRDLDPKVTLWVKNSTFADNEAHRYDNSGAGGAVQLSLTVKADFINNTFTGNICENPDTNQRGLGAALGSHYGRLSGLNFRGPTITFKNNLFVGNTGKPYSSTDNKQINVGGTMTQTDAGGNVGYDHQVAADTDLTIEAVYGVSSISVAENGSYIEAGCNLTTSEGIQYSEVTIPTYWIAPAITDDDGNIVNTNIHADNAAASKEYEYDQRGMPRVDDDDASDAGSVEIISAKFDANLGTWVNGSTYTYEDPLLYVKKLAEDTEYTYVYSAVDAGTENVEEPDAPTRTDFVFKGWTQTKDGDDVTDEFTPGSTYYAKWGQEVRLDLTYHLNDGSLTTKVDPDGTYLENAAVSVKSIADLLWAAPADCYFKGWTSAAAPLPADRLY